jgi:hypothetical protein
MLRGSKIIFYCCKCSQQINKVESSMMQVNMLWIFLESNSCKQSKNVASIHMWPFVGFQLLRKTI